MPLGKPLQAPAAAAPLVRADQFVKGVGVKWFVPGKSNNRSINRMICMRRFPVHLAYPFLAAAGAHARFYKEFARPSRAGAQPGRDHAPPLPAPWPAEKIAGRYVVRNAQVLSRMRARREFRCGS
jgi:hypothetical protein